MKQICFYKIRSASVVHLLLELIVVNSFFPLPPNASWVLSQNLRLHISNELTALHLTQVVRESCVWLTYRATLTLRSLSQLLSSCHNKRFCGVEVCFGVIEPWKLCLCPACRTGAWHGQIRRKPQPEAHCLLPVTAGHISLCKQSTRVCVGVWACACVCRCNSAAYSCWCVLVDGRLSWITDLKSRQILISSEVSGYNLLVQQFAVLVCWKGDFTAEWLLVPPVFSLIWEIWARLDGRTSHF